jgi:hypothetical protein
MGCGINFKWITPAEAAMNQEAPHIPPRSQLKGKTPLSLVNRKEIIGQGPKQGLTAAAEKKELHGGKLTGQFKADISRLLYSFLENHTNCNKA